MSAPSPEDDPLVLEDGRLWFVGGGFAMTGHNFGRVDSTPPWLVSAMEQLGIEHY